MRQFNLYSEQTIEIIQKKGSKCIFRQLISIIELISILELVNSDTII